MYNICRAVATLFGIGYIPKMPGTFGSIAALPIAFIILNLGNIYALLCAFALVTVIGYFAVAVVLRKSESTDPGYIIIDEVSGQILTLIPVMALYPSYSKSWLVYAAALLLFRLFDIIKPWHVGYADKNIKGSLGVMADDVIAGVYAAVCVLLCMVVYILVSSLMAA